MDTVLYKIDSENQKKEIEESAEILRRGGLVAIPTETVYGLAANALDGGAVKKIFKAKGRPQDNPLIVHISSFDEIYPLVKEVPKEAFALAEKYWPGPLTMIMPKSDLIPDEVSAGLSTVAIRMPSHPIARAIIKAAGVPLAAPSANSSGLPSPTKASHVFDDMNGKIDAIVDSGECGVGVESTVITLATKPPRLLRPGGITPEQLTAVLGKIDIDNAVTHKLAEGAVASSPGMKYKHYSPKAQVYIIKGPFPSYRCFTDYEKKDGDMAVCFDGEEKLLGIDAVSYGAENDSKTQAHRLFDLLRNADKVGAKRVFVRYPKTDGVGLAVYNRLIRAAAFRIINVPPIYGLTGPTGAGKSTVAAELQKRGWRIIDGDMAAREVMKKGSPLLGKLKEEYGEDIILPDGSLDRKALAEKAFKDKSSAKRLGELTHPAITDLVMRQIIKEKDEYPVFVIDAALITECKMYDYISKLIVVTADEEIRLKRITERDGISEQAAKERINAQPSAQYYESKADVIIKNNGGEIDLSDIF